jgi:hypothetical protein
VLQILLDKNDLSFAKIPRDAKARMTQYIDWVFAANTLTEQHIKSFNGYCAPKSEFDNLTLAEFHFTELFYRQIIDGDGHALDKLIAVLCREPKKDYDFKRDVDGDARAAFNANVINYSANRISKTFPAKVKTAILMWYDGCRQHLAELYPDAFSAPGAKETSDELGMYDMIRSLSGDRFGTINEVEKVFVHTAFVEIEKIIEENRKTEAQLKLLK